MSLRIFGAQGLGLTWRRLAKVSLTADTHSLDTGTFAACAHLMFLIHILGTNPADIAQINFNGDVGANYCETLANYPLAGTTYLGQNSIFLINVNEDRIYDLSCILNNQATEIKQLFMPFLNNLGNNTTGANSQLRILWGRWVNTVNQITRIVLSTIGAGGTLRSGTSIEVWGAN